MRTTTKKVEKTEVKEEKKEFNLKECMTLWIHESKQGNKYLTGMLADGIVKVVGYFNNKKKNPKEPDINIFMLDSEGKQDIQVASLWSNVSENDKKYASGYTNDKEKIVGFYNNPDINNRPYLKVYYKQD